MISNREPRTLIQGLYQALRDRRLYGKENRINPIGVTPSETALPDHLPGPQS